MMIELDAFFSKRPRRRQSFDPACLADPLRPLERQNPSRLEWTVGEYGSCCTQEPATEQYVLERSGVVSCFDDGRTDRFVPTLSVPRLAQHPVPNRVPRLADANLVQEVLHPTSRKVVEICNADDLSQADRAAVAKALE